MESVVRPTLLEERRRGYRPRSESSMSSSTAASSKSQVGTFQERQEALLLKQGRGNATKASRIAVAMEDPEVESTNGHELQSTCSVASKAPSLHPSVATSIGLSESTLGAGDDTAYWDFQHRKVESTNVHELQSTCSVASKAPSLHPSVATSIGLSESTLGAGDDTAYWDFQHRKVEKKDLGHKCFECKETFKALGAALTERRGGRVSMRYHGECFSGFADPRSQARSSHHEGRLKGSQLHAAPQEVTSKMRTAKHFEQGGRVASSIGGKFGTMMAMGHNSFGSKSSKGKVHVPQRAPGDLTEEQLAAHERQLQAIDEEKEMSP